MFPNFYRSKVSTPLDLPTGRRRFPQSSRGFSIVSAIFLLVAMAALGAAMLTFSTIQSTSSATDVQGTRAYWAARSGLDLGAYQALNAANTCATGCTMPASCVGAATSGSSTLNQTIGGFTVTITCNCTPVCEAGTVLRMFRLVANACSQPTSGACPNAAATAPTYVERQATSMVSKCVSGC